MTTFFSRILPIFGFNLVFFQPSSVVFAVFFYSASCVHCQTVITETLPPLREEYGDQLELIYVDVSGTNGARLFNAIGDTLAMSEDLRGHVPTVVVGSVVLVGADQIERELGILVGHGLETGGVPLPEIPGMAQHYARILDLKSQRTDQNESSDASEQVLFHHVSWVERFEQDITANLFAVGVLIAQVVTLAALMIGGVKMRRVGRVPQWLAGARRGAFAVIGLATLVAVSTLIWGTVASTIASGLALTVLVCLLIALWTLGRHRRVAPVLETLPVRSLFFLAVAGLLVAFYLSYVEVGNQSASCGAFGQCNTVQSSLYARVAGIPVGLLGMAGYSLIILVSLSAWFWPSTMPWSQPILLLLTGVGLLFSAYLTFLEPFVIGATCMWCITSALIMMLLSWHVFPTTITQHAASVLLPVD